MLAAVAGVAVLAVGDEGMALAPAAGDSHPALPPGAVPGMIAVADSGNNRIQVFYPNGTFAFMFGHPHRPSSIAVGPIDGRIVVGDSNCCSSSTARVFNPDGTPAFEFRTGAGLGTIWHPRGVAVGPDGKIVVGEGDRIQVFNPDGSFALAFGSRTGEDKLVDVVDVAVGPDGKIVVGDAFRSTAPVILIFHPNGTLASEFVLDWADRHAFVGSGVAAGPGGQIAVAGAYGVYVYSQLSNGTSGFVGSRVNGSWSNPSDVAFGPDGRIIVADNHDRTDRSRVHVHLPINPNSSFVQHPNSSLVPGGSFALTFGSYGAVHTGFDSPTDAAVGPDGRIVVAEPGNYSIRVFHPNGTQAFSFGSYGSGDGHFYIPNQVAVGPDGRIVVGDNGKRRIQVFESDGTPVLAFGSHGRGEREFWQVHDVAVGPDGQIAVADPDNDRVQVYHPNGSLALTIPVHLPFYVAVGPDGRIVASGSDGVQVFNPDGALVIGTDRAGNLAVGPDGRIVVTSGNFITVLNPDGSLAFASQIEAYATGVDVGPDGRIVVVDNIVDDRVHVFNPDGTYGFALLSELSEGGFSGNIAVAVGPLVPPPESLPAPASLPVVLTPSAGGLRNFTSAGDAASLTMNVTGLAEQGGPPLDGSESSTVVFPPAETVVAASFAEVSFPPSVRASHVPADGVLALRIAGAGDAPTAERMQDALGRNGTEIVLLQRVVEVGAEGSRVVFDLPIRILLEGQAGGRAFWVEGSAGAEGGNGTITPIDVQCDAVDDTAAVHDQLGGAGECQVDDMDGGAKIVYTYHLTQFGTVASGGPAPQPVFFGGGGGGGAGAANGTGPSPPVPPVVAPPPAPSPANGTGPSPPVPPPTCSMAVVSSGLSVSMSPGEYSQPVGQTLINSGSLPFARVEIGATPWSVDRVGGALSAPPAAVPPPPEPAPPAPALGPNEGRLSGILTALLVATLPAGATEVSEQVGAAGGWEPVANGTTAVAAGLEGGDEAPLWFRLNLTPYPNLEAGTTLVQRVTYQAECAPLP